MSNGVDLRTTGGKRRLSIILPLVYSFRRASFVFAILVIMASSDAFGFLRKLTTEENSHSSSDPILAKFKAIAEKLKVYTNPESISWLYVYDLIDTHTDWRVLKEKNKPVKGFFSFHNAAQANEQSAILSKLIKIENQLQQDSSRHTNLLLWDDRYTSYKPHPNTCIEDDVSDESEKLMVGWLLTSSGDDFTAIGIYGMGGSGKTALVKNVLKQKTVGDKFKCIIWACLSQLTSEEEIEDYWIIKYLLYRSGLDTDSLVGNMYENKDSLMEKLKSRLLNSGNYILVLDDMWHCNKRFADFLGKLKKIRGGAVIVTSRRKTVAEQIGDKNRLIHLNPCDDAYKESAFLKDEAKDLGK